MRQYGGHFADDIFKCIFLNENVRISIEYLRKFVPKGPINNIPALVQIMAWRRAGNKPLSEPMMVSLPTHIYASLGLNELTKSYPHDLEHEYVFCEREYELHAPFQCQWMTENKNFNVSPKQFHT